MIQNGHVLVDTARGASDAQTGALVDRDTFHINGVELVSPARRAPMAAIQFSGMDEVMGFPTS